MTTFISYYTFDVSFWRLHICDSAKNLSLFVGPMLEFVCTALERGDSVLVHCLVGAHRAGTTGVICVMHLHGQCHVTGDLGHKY